MKNSLIILAHQDDEIAIYPQIKRLIEHKHRVWVAYLTTGTLDASHSVERTGESIKNLLALGVNECQIRFLGDDYAIADKTLCRNLELAADGLLQLAKRIGVLSDIYTLAWEGGHPDHDAAHLVGVFLAQQLQLLDNCYQFSLYNGADLAWFRRVRLFYPLRENGRIQSYRISWHMRYVGLKLTLGYNSQKKVLVWLFPLLLYHYVFDGRQHLQGVSLKRLLQKPHELHLRYEQNKFYSYLQFRHEVDGFVAKYFR